MESSLHDEAREPAPKCADRPTDLCSFLEHDERPTFVLDLRAEQASTNKQLHPVYYNPALLAQDDFAKLVRGSSEASGPNSEYTAFANWARSVPRYQWSQSNPPTKIVYDGVPWAGIVIQDRWKIIYRSHTRRRSHAMEPQRAKHRHSTLPDLAGQVFQSSEEEPVTPFAISQTTPSPLQRDFMTSTPSRGSPTEISFPELSPSSSYPSNLDWTKAPVKGVTDHIEFVRTFDWGSTGLGPMDQWSDQLRCAVTMVMSAPIPMAMYWGSDYTTLYNERFTLIIGQKHPKMMGQNGIDAFPESWDHPEALFDQVKATGRAARLPKMCIFHNARGYYEEGWVAFTMTPILGGDGTVAGFVCPIVEITSRVLVERRISTMMQMNDLASSAQDMKEFWNLVAKSLTDNVEDIPFALIYSVSDPSNSDQASNSSDSSAGLKYCVLEETVGVSQGPAALPTYLDLHEDRASFMPSFRKAMKTCQPVLIRASDGSLPPTLAQGVEGRGFGDSVSEAVICPIVPVSSESIIGFVLVGINPRKKYDRDYELFIQLLSRQVTTSAASVLLIEEEAARHSRAAAESAIRQAWLNDALNAQVLETKHSEVKFSLLAEKAPIGVMILDPDGDMTFANEAWQKMQSFNEMQSGRHGWKASIHEEDLPMVVEKWERMMTDKQAVIIECRTKRAWKTMSSADGTLIEVPTWLLASVFPVVGEKGDVKCIMGCHVDISSQKWAEASQTEKLREALEMKRQRENFMDMTSHEMRNPLSSILQCADDILHSSRETLDHNGDVGEAKETLQAAVDAAETIILCAQHQRRIVDDILTMSKLDSNLLLMTPDPARPVAIIKHALKMFSGEFRSHHVETSLVVGHSIRELDVDWVMLDPSRLLQIFINLITNAIKFTQYEATRIVTATVEASLKRPCNNGNINFFPPRSTRARAAFGSEWGSGEDLYLQFSVQDTGPGLTDEEMKMLFHRFSQASPKTHAQYGGSGLGLFISRELCEAQGGQIGVSSTPGVGTTFTFYIRGRRTEAPATDFFTASNDHDGTDATTPGELSQATPPFEHHDTRRNSVADAIRRKKSNADTTAEGTRVKAEAFTRSSRPSSSHSLVHEKIPPSSIHILLVEDNLVNQKVMSKQLQKVGFTVHVANHGVEALDFLLASTFAKPAASSATTNASPAATSCALAKKAELKPLSLVLMDLEMPVMDGLTCIRHVRQKQEPGGEFDQAHIPVISVTANARTEQQRDAMEAGMDAVVTKPFRIPDLVPQIEELVWIYGTSFPKEAKVV
ncbi:MAG: hypothetical protein M1820_008327 [Bogoriella megaspora]|nr:MAG: hypothetical protein M1820_008327 [Bogoriella megaspora]